MLSGFEIVPYSLLLKQLPSERCRAQALVRERMMSSLTEPAGNKIAAVDMDGDGRSGAVRRDQPGRAGAAADEGAPYAAVVDEDVRQAIAVHVENEHVPAVGAGVEA